MSNNNNNNNDNKDINDSNNNNSKMMVSTVQRILSKNPLAIVNGGERREGIMASVCRFHVERPVYQQEELNDEYKSERTSCKSLDDLQSSHRKFRLSSCLTTLIPALNWLVHYQVKDDLFKDCIAGITVAVMHIPQGMAYAMLGNVPPVVGLYMAFFPVIIYSFLGTSRHISMGTFSVTCLMVGKVVLEHSQPMAATLVPDGNSTDVNATSTLPRLAAATPVEVATTVCFIVGMYQLVMYVMRLGVLTSLLSDTLVSSFTAAAAFLVITSQIKDILGIQMPKKYSGNFSIIYTYIAFFQSIDSTNKAALTVSLITITILWSYDDIVKPRLRQVTSVPIPIELIVILAGTLISRFTPLIDENHIRTVGHIAVGLPEPSPPRFDLIPSLLGECFSIAVVAYVIAMSMALTFSTKLKYDLDANQEFLAQGVSNVFGSFFSCMPISASLSRSVIQQVVGGKTQVAGLVSSSIIFCVLLWIGPFFEPLPRCVLASLIVVAVKNVLLQVRAFPKIWRLSFLDGLVYILTFLTVILVEVDIGLIVGFSVSLASILIQGIRPYCCLLGRVPNTDIYVDKTRFNTVDMPGIKIVHYSGGLNFANRGYFKSGIHNLLHFWPRQEINRRNQMIKSNKVGPLEFSNPMNCLILDLAAMHYCDPAGVNTLRSIGEEFKELSIPVYITGASGPVYESFQNNDLISQNLFHFFPTVHDAVLYDQIIRLESANTIIQPLPEENSSTL
ncbi:prestin [Bemisia tabaci]|uniref:prestin n=1 Tax=Bemisia tabaci TaxID=7038 RepID=UPI003B2878AC